jgi:hypothetical protein
MNAIAPKGQETPLVTIFENGHFSLFLTVFI